MVFRRSLLACLALLTTSAMAADLPKPIRILQAKGISIAGEFDAPSGMKGYAAEYRGQGMTLYLTPDGDHIISGRMFDAQGNDQSQAVLERLVYAPLGKKMWERMEKSDWISDGDSSAPLKIYVFGDANCPYCTAFWSKARPWVDAGKVELRHIMLGIIKADSSAKAAALMAAADPSRALHEHESTGRASTLKAMSKIPADLQKKLDANMELAEDMGVAATPAIFYLGKDGRLEQQQGVPQSEADLVSILGEKP
ncbi:TPA: thiol:disulfide interchange protein DsbG [Pseudomonas aeruginosa]